MKLANQQKLIVGVASFSVLVLLVTTIWSRPGFLYKSPTLDQQQSLQQQQAKSLAEYREYLKSIKADPVASSLIFDQVVDKKEIAAQINSFIGAGKSVAAPEIRQADLKIVNATDATTVGQYVTDLDAVLNRYAEAVMPQLEGAFADTPNLVAARQADSESKSVINALYAQTVPRVAVPMHTSILSSYQSMQNLLVDNRTALESGNTDKRFTRLVGSFGAAREQLENIQKMSDGLRQYVASGAVSEDVASGNYFIPVAQALIGGPVVIIEDVPRRIDNALKSFITQVILTAFRSFSATLIQQLDKKFLISNYLYYTDALVNVRYANDYLNKYVEDPKDRLSIKQFLPQFNCGRLDEEKIRKQMQAKAIDYLGFDPKLIDPSDPAFYEKLAKTATDQGDPTGAGYKRFYQSFAAVAESAAKGAAGQEQANPGRKASRDIVSGQIATSINSVSAKIEAALNALFNTIPTNAATTSPALAAFFTGSTFAVLGQLIVTGATIREQKTCIAVDAAPGYDLLIPGDFTPNPGQPTQDDVQRCLDDPNVCAGVIFENPNNGYGILATCPNLDADPDPVQGRVIDKGLVLSINPPYAKVGVPLSINYTMQPACAPLLQSFDTTSPKLTLYVYPTDLPGSNLCEVPTDSSNPNLALVVDVQKGQTSIDGSIEVDSEKIARRYEKDNNGNYRKDEKGNYIPIIKGGPQGVAVLMIGQDTSGLPICLNGLAQVNLELPNNR